MRVVVFCKHVPELVSDRGFDDAGRTVRRADDSSMNEVDENAVEAALQLADDGDVVAVTLGPPAAIDTLRRALAMGVTEAVHVCDPACAGGDVVATARVLAATVRHLGAERPIDAVLTGLAALDGLGSVVPSLLAAELDWPQLTVVEEIASDRPGALVARRELDGATEQWRVQGPAVVSVMDTANDPRLPKMKDLMAARRAEVRRLTPDDLGLDAADVGAAGSRTEVLSAERSPEHPGPEVITDDDGGGGAALARYLIEHDLVGGNR